MGGFLLRRVGAALIVLLLSSMLVFIGVRALPGDPATALGAENRDPAVMKAIRHHYWLDQPVPVQYAKWLRPPGAGCPCSAPRGWASGRREPSAATSATFPCPRRSSTACRSRSSSRSCRSWSDC